MTGTSASADSDVEFWADHSSDDDDDDVDSEEEGVEFEFEEEDRQVGQKFPSLLFVELSFFELAFEHVQTLSRFHKPRYCPSSNILQNERSKEKKFRKKL